MLKEASKILEIIVEFCRENMNMLMVAGVALIVLLLIISLVRPSKEDDDFDFDEFAKKFEGNEEKSTDIKEKLVDIKESISEPICIQQPLRTAEVEAEIETDETERTVEEKIEETFEEKVEEEKQSFGFTKNTMSLGAIVDELAEITGEGVKKVEIRIPGAEVRITYLDEDKKDDYVEAASSEKLISEKEALEETKSQIEQIEETEKTQETDAEAEEVENKTAPAIRKFGPGNMNVTRSGKVFSEEELQKQIRD